MHRYLPPTVFIVVAAIGLGMTTVVHNAEEAAIKTRFEVVADEVVDRIQQRVSQHIAFLVATQSFFAANDRRVSKRAFKTFVDGLDLENRLKGIQGVGYARMIPTEPNAEAEVVTAIEANYGIDRKVWPETSQDTRTPIVLLEPNDIRNAAALGYDMFSDTARRTAMIGAVTTAGAYASAPVELVQEITTEKQVGFLVYVPIRKRETIDNENWVDGFIFAPFRAGDFHAATLSRFPPPPAVVETIDTTDGESTPLFRSPNFDEVSTAGSIQIVRTLEVAGRMWTLSIHDTPAFRRTTNKLGTFALAIISLMLAGALAAVTRFQFTVLSTAQKLQALSEKSLADKDMMLQEMKHRIKNSIARVLAMARQTAMNAETIEDFSGSFSARLQAMANAQDMLTRSHWQRADLRELLGKELAQVFGKSPSDSKVSGPPVLLDERTTQALGLTFHELATNAIKYGGISEEDGDLSVHWHLEGSNKKPLLVVEWVETSGKIVDEPGESGFGTRLIDANIKGELRGTIERTFSPNGMSIRITAPVDPQRA